MNFKKIIFSTLLAAGCLSAFAQEAEETIEVFNPHWYVQGQLGGQYTLGEVKFGKLLSPNFQIAGGYQFTPIWGARLALNGFQSKAGSNLTSGKYYWKWNYLSPTIDATCDLTSLFGAPEDRIYNVGVLAGIGANIAFKNDEAWDTNKQIAADHGHPATSDVAYLGLLWDGTKTRFTGRLGAYVDFHVTPRIDVGLELTANTLSDNYNSKKAENADWYFNGLVGVRFNLGKLTKTVTRENPCREVIVEKIVEKPVEKIVERVVYRDREVTNATAEVREPLKREIFFPIRGSQISPDDMKKVNEIVEYMKKYPDAKVTVTAYADKGTGNSKLNQMYSERRAKITHDMLVKKGVASKRIITIAKGDTEQPFIENDRNRVSICVAE